MPNSIALYTNQKAVIERLNELLNNQEDSPDLVELVDREADQDNWQLHTHDNKLALGGYLDKDAFSISFELDSAEINYRHQKGGGRQEPLAKAIGLKKNWHPYVIDATAGMGREAYLLYLLGCHVIAFERHPIIALLLIDAYHRASPLNDQEHSLDIQYGDAIEQLERINKDNQQVRAPDVIYMDPMFPTRKKSAAVKKEMRVFKQIAGADLDADKLLEVALKTAKHRVVVKRPAAASFVNDRKPDHQIISKKHRFDVYLIH